MADDTQVLFAKGRICGIDKKFISNYDEYKLLLDEMICKVYLTYFLLLLKNIFLVTPKQ